MQLSIFSWFSANCGIIIMNWFQSIIVRKPKGWQTLKSVSFDTCPFYKKKGCQLSNYPHYMQRQPLVSKVIPIDRKRISSPSHYHIVCRFNSESCYKDTCNKKCSRNKQSNKNRLIIFLEKSGRYCYYCCYNDKRNHQNF